MSTLKHDSMELELQHAFWKCGFLACFINLIKDRSLMTSNIYGKRGI